MAAHNWELVRDLGIALQRGDNTLACELTHVIKQEQRECSHVANPDREAKPDFPLLKVGLTTLGERCYKCGASMPVVKPGIVKAQQTILERKAVG